MLDNWLSLAACFIAAVAGFLLYVKLAMPDPRELQRLRAQEASLQETVALLERRGGKADVTHCRDSKGKSRRCIRTEEKYELFESYDKATYRVIVGY